jgi:hypothetical protein
MPNCIEETANEHPKEQRDCEGKRKEVECPDCMALLEVVSKHNVPDDVHLRFVEHRS